jgi:hypothetical protein
MVWVRPRSIRPLVGLFLALSLTAPAAAAGQIPSLTPTATPSPGATPSPTATPSPSATPTVTPTPTPTPPPAKKTKAIRKVYKDFDEDGLITACDHSVKVLRKTLATITPQRQSDYPEFRLSIRAAIRQHRKGHCAKPTPTPTPTATPAPSGGGGSPGTGGTIPAPVPAPAAPAPAPTAAPVSPGTLPKVHHGGGGKPVKPPSATATPTPTPAPAPAPAPLESQTIVSRPHDSPSLLIPLILAAVALAGLAAAGGSALLGNRFPRLAGVGQAWREAGYRTSATWGDFNDWLHLGR